MASKETNNDTLSLEEAPHSVFLDSGEIVTVMATSAQEAVEKVKESKKGKK